MKARLLGVSLVAALGAGCGVNVQGDFDGVPFTPDASILAVADRHDLLLRNDAVIPVRRPLPQQKIHLVLSGAYVDVTDDWRRETAEDLLDLKRALATADGLLLKDISLDAFDDAAEGGGSLRAVVDNGRVEGDFDVAVAQSLPEAELVEGQGLGTRLEVTVTPQFLDAQPRGGSMSLEIEIQRGREAGQENEVATGAVSLTLSTSFSPERLGESNLTVAEPVLRCMAKAGPARAGGCRDVDELPYVDETGLVEP